jgi:hypothetical protein
MSVCTSITKQGKPCKNGLNCHLHNNETESCSICLNPARKTRGVKDLRCGHRFHKKCINEWVEKGGNTCPMCRKSIDETKFKVSIRIENTEHNVTNTWPLPSFSISALMNGLNMEEFHFGTSEIRMNLDTSEDFELFIRDLGIRITDLDALIFDTE